LRLQLWRRRVSPVETVDSAIRCSKLSKSLCPLRLDLDFIVSSNLLVFRRREPQRKGSQPDSRRTGEIFGKFISPIANCNSTPSGSQAKRKLVRQKENRCTKESEEAYLPRSCLRTVLSLSGAVYLGIVSLPRFRRILFYFRICSAPSDRSE